MLPRITDRSETYSSHLQRLIKVQSLRTALYGNGESAPLGSPGERLCWHLPPPRNKLTMLPGDRSLETSAMLCTSPARRGEQCAHSTIKPAHCAACGSGEGFPAPAGLCTAAGLELLPHTQSFSREVGSQPAVRGTCGNSYN